MARVGVVVPVYNTGPLLHGTIDSIVGQKFADWSCVLVDDGSTDGSGEVCAEAAEGDTRFIAVHQANFGISAARNAGLAHISDSEYVVFMDHDDVWLPHALTTLVDAADR